MSDTLTRLAASLADRYRIERELGQGGMATVYLAHDIKHDRQVAIKVLKPELAADMGAERFLREIRTTANLRHPHILPLYDSGDADGILYYVMPSIEGETLRHRLDRERQLPVEEMLRLTSEVGAALHYAHGHGVIHRDIKPENILLEEGQALVADFGIARAVGPADRTRLTQAGMSIGTPLYASPEQALADTVDARSDLYSLACVCYEMLAGTPPFSGPTPVVLMARHAIDPVPSLATARPGLSLSIARAIERALAKTPEDRYASVAEFVTALTLPPTTPIARASVAVLPFRLVGTGAEDEYFADGITEDVIAHLSKLKNLSVIARNSVLPFRNREQPLREIAARLEVATILDGSIRRAGTRVRVVAQLIDPERGRNLWAETYDRELADIFAIQTDVALQIATALEAELSPAERNRIHKEPTADVQAYTLYLQGRHAFGRYTTEGLHRGIEFFERAITRDPDYALAWVGIAMCCTEMGEGGMMVPDEAYRKARTAVDRALLLDAGLGEAHSAAAHLKVVQEFDWEAAEAGYRRALELNPNSADIHDLFGRMYSAMSRHDEAIEHLRRAQALDPLTHKLDLTTELLRAERYPEALTAAMLAVELDPQDARAHATLGWALFLSGRLEEGVEALRSATTLSGTSVQWLAQLGQACGLAGRTDEAREVLRMLAELAQSTFVSPYHLAFVHIGLGEHELALDHLERALNQRSGATYGIRASFLLKPLHGHPRFEALVRKINLA